MHLDVHTGDTMSNIEELREALEMGNEVLTSDHKTILVGEEWLRRMMEAVEKVCKEESMSEELETISTDVTSRRAFSLIARGVLDATRGDNGASGMTDSLLIVTDRTALETSCETCEGRGCENGCGLHGGCAHAHDGPDSHRIHAWCKGRGVVFREFVVLGDAQLLVPCPRVQAGLGARDLWWCVYQDCPCRGSGLVPAPVGSTPHDIEIAERREARVDWDTDMPYRDVYDVPFARVRTVHVVARDKLVLAHDNPDVRWDGELLKAPMVDTLPDGDPLYVCDGVTAL
jgi:hypothetical protein